MWQPVVTADLEAVLEGVKGDEVLLGENETVNLEVGDDAGLGDRLGDDGVSVLETPGEENLLDGPAVLLGDASEGLVLNKGRVGGAEDGVTGDVDALLSAELGEAVSWVVGVEFDLVDGLSDDIFVSKLSFFNILIYQLCQHTGTIVACLSSLLSCVISKLETPMFLTRPEAGSFSISFQASR